VAHPENPERIVIGMEGQILYSIDGGKNRETVISFEVGTSITKIKQHPIQHERIYITGSQGGTAEVNLFFMKLKAEVCYSFNNKK